MTGGKRPKEKFLIRRWTQTNVREDGYNANTTENETKRLIKYRAEMGLSLQEYFLGDKPGGVREFRARETQQTPPLSDPPVRTTSLATAVAISGKKKTFFFLF